uniref:Osteonectin-like protein n=1 Tax=Phragmatopoma lapidosa TaxID=341668 RepID=C9E3A3_9ANNE|nr:osteonectin-like protein [Phragmatopoma lapidosa]
MKVLVFLVLCLFVADAIAAKKVKNDDKENALENPCDNISCGLGETCVIKPNRKAACECIEECYENKDPRAMVCSTQNVTFPSECELYRQRCLCRNKDKECDKPKYKKGHLHYFGTCKVMDKCTDFEFSEFPGRMAQWLYHVMDELAKRKDLTKEEIKMAREARRSNKKWVLPVIWKFCDLDISHDMRVTSRELLPITAPLMPYEHCTGPFIESCDANKDDVISLAEWGKCLNLEDDEIENKCAALRD